MGIIIRDAIGFIMSLALPIGIIAGAVKLIRRSMHRGDGTIESGVERRPALPGTAERVFLYALCFAGLMAVLFAVAGLLAVLMVPVIPGAGALISARDLSDRVSYDLAALIVGTPLWLGLWRLAARRVASMPAERETTARRLFLAGTFGVTAVTALVGLQHVVQNALLLGSSVDHGSHVQDTVVGAATFLTYGTAWVLYARLGWRERAAVADDWTHDVAVSVTSAAALIFLFVGASGLLAALLAWLNDSTGATILGGSPSDGWDRWAGALSWTAIGGGALAALHRYDAARGGDRIVRVLYEYAMLLWLVPVSLGAAGMLTYEILRRLFGYTQDVATWNFLADSLPAALTGMALGIYVWSLVRREATLRPETTSGGIPYPRRLAIAVLAFGGLAGVGVGTVTVLWVMADAVAGTRDPFAAGTWWRDELSTGIALLVVGGMVWAPSWRLLQRAVVERPEVEGAALERRLMVGGAGLIASVLALGFSVALLYEIWRTVLGAGNSNALLMVLHDVSAVAVAGGIALYYGLTFRADSRRRADVVETRKFALRVLLAPGGKEILDGLIAEFPASSAVILGYLPALHGEPISDVPSLRGQLAALGTPGHADRGMLVLGGEGGRLYAYAREAGWQDASAPASGALDLHGGMTTG